MPSIKHRVIEALALVKKCERCGALGATLQPSRTQYTDPKENVDMWMCPYCAEEYHLYWDEMWADYYSSSGVVHVSRQELTDLRKRASICAMKPNT